MKRFIATILLASSALSLASERNIYDVMYLPTAGTSYGFTQLDYGHGRYSYNENLYFDAEDFGLTQTLGHALSDRFSFQASLNYLYRNEDNFPINEQESRSGLSDLTVEGKYRLLDESLLWDVLFGVTAGAGDAEVDADTSTNATGTPSAQLGTQFGMKHTHFQWAGMALVRHNFPGSVEVFDTAVKTDAYNEFLIKVDALVKFTEATMIRATGSTNFANEFGNDLSPETTTASTTTYRGELEFQYLINKDLLLRAGLDYIHAKQSARSQYDDKMFNFRFGANYQF